MNSETLQYQIALTMIPKIGAITARKLIEYIGSPEGVFMEKTSHLRAIPGVGEYLAAQVSAKNYLAEAGSEMLQMQKRGISSVWYQDEAYPWQLKNCADAPLLLFYRGIHGFNRTKTLSVVGTRNATHYGREMCEAIISKLAAGYPDMVIVSGLAYGIDIMAHRFALKYGLDTWAVLAHGLHTLYPSSHADVAGRIMKQGALMSDFPTTIKPERNNFLRRNRIIAGLSEATLVVESGPKGGALITAELAASYSREVFAVPGRVGDTYSSGCNRLIQNNIAALIENGTDIEKLLGWEPKVSQEEPQNAITEPLTEEERLILRAINDDPGLGLEILSIRTGIPLHKLSGTLLQMELRNWITTMPGNLYKASVRVNT
ncbi:MAG: DNA-processing protein DprA [Bacteroidales bacterium]